MLTGCCQQSIQFHQSKNSGSDLIFIHVKNATKTFLNMNKIQITLIFYSVNTVQRHTKCSTNYCLRKKTNETELKCRFHFPFEQKPQTTLEFEEINSKDHNVNYRAKIFTNRYDPRVNNHQRLKLQGWESKL